MCLIKSGYLLYVINRNVILFFRTVKEQDKVKGENDILRNIKADNLPTFTFYQDKTQTDLIFVFQIHHVMCHYLIFTYLVTVILLTFT